MSAGRTWLLVAAASMACGLAPAQQPPRAFATIAAMCAAAGLGKSELVTVEGYRRAGDDGGGTFRYDPESQAEANGGTVFAPDRGAGRLVRVFGRDDDARAEWFGAYGDGDSAAPHDDHAAINQCLKALGRVKLLANTYGVRGKPDQYSPNATYHALDLGPYYRVVGSGREATKIKLLDGTNPHGSGPGENYFIVISNRAFHESAEHVVIRDLTIDCNFDGQDRVSTIHAIGIRGGGALVERVNFRNYGTGRNPEGGFSRECFVIHQTLVYKDRQSCRRAAVLRDLDFTACGHNGDLAGGVGEITHIALGGANNFDNLGWIMPQGKDPDWDPADGGENERNWWPSYGGLIENVYIHDLKFDPATQKSPLHGFTYGDCIGLTIRGNRVERFEGSAVFTMSWWNRNTVITDNQFLGVETGLAACLQSQDAKPVQCPRHEDVLFAHNTIELGSPPHAPWGTCGISLFGGDMPATVRMDRIHIRENTITGRAYTNAKGERSCPLGMKVQILRATYHDLRFEDNIIDVPDYAPASWVPQEPFAMSLFYFPIAMWEDAVKQGHVVYRNNRNKEGKLLLPFLADWWFKNAATWGQMAD